MASFIYDILYFRHIYLLFNPRNWLIIAKIPKKVMQNLLAIRKYPDIYRLTRHVDGLISFNVGMTLYESVLNSGHPSKSIIEVGAYKGLSTIYLSLAARETGRRVKSFELFTGLPSVDNDIDKGFENGEFSSSPAEYMANLNKYGCPETVDLVIGDARERLLPAVGKGGFAVAFLDADVYGVTKDLLMKLWSIAQGGEVIIIHDAFSPGMRKAIDEFRKATNNANTESFPEVGTLKFIVPRNKIKTEPDK